MGMDLRGAGGEFHFTNLSWLKVLELAENCGGWEPTGTARSERDEDAGSASWSGGYATNDYQFVTDADALALAEALEKVLADIPDHDCLAAYRVTVPEIPGLVGIDARVATRVTPLEYFSGSAKGRIREFITYCRTGGFYIC